MKFFVINLKGAPQRLQRFYELNGYADKIERLEAVDGKDLNVDLLENAGHLQKGYRGYSPESLERTMSHRILWEKSIALNEPITVFEDDAILNNRFFEKSEKIIAAIPESWDFVSWGWNFDSVLQFFLPNSYSPCATFYDQNHLRANVKRFKEQNASHQIFKLHSQFGAMAYSISPRGAETFMKFVFPIREKIYYVPGLKKDLPNVSFDGIANDYYKFTRSYVCFPPLAITKHDEHTTETEEQANQKKSEHVAS